MQLGVQVVRWLVAVVGYVRSLWNKRDQPVVVVACGTGGWWGVW